VAWGQGRNPESMQGARLRTRPAVDRGSRGGHLSRVPSPFPALPLLMRAAFPIALLATLAGCASRGAALPDRGTPPAPVPTRVALRQFIDSLAESPDFRSAQWGLLVVDPGRGETLYSRNADKLFMPASNMKLVTGSAAVTQLGLGHRWTTSLLARGPVRNGVLEGDLVVRGNGDPTVSAHMYPLDALTPLRALADSLKARGITRVRGQLVAAPSPFVDAQLGYGWSWDDLDESYSAGVDALYFNEGFTEVVAYGGAKAGDPVRVVTRPLPAYPIRRSSFAPPRWPSRPWARARRTPSPGGPRSAWRRTRHGPACS
jgi:D-alanyl-D-alanine carboxypeptidase